MNIRKENKFKEVSPDEIIGKNMRLFRRDALLSSATLGEVLGVSAQQMQKYETGKNKISASNLYKIALFLEKPIQYFFEKDHNG